MANIIRNTAAIVELAEKEMGKIHEKLKLIREAVEKLKELKSTDAAGSYLSVSYSSIDLFKGGLYRKDHSSPINIVENNVTDLDRSLQDSDARNKINGLKNEYAAAKKSFFEEAAEKIKQVDNHLHNMSLQASRADRKGKGIPGPEPELDKIETEGALALNMVKEVEAKLNEVKDKLKALREFIISLE